MDPKELEQRGHLAEEDQDSVRPAVPRIALLNEPLRHHDGDGSLTAESTSELGEDREVGVQPNPIQSTNAQRGERPLVLGASELALDSGPATVEGSTRRR
jgi:hypothetical protein